MSGAEPAYAGTVKSFNSSKGWGFLESAETQQAYGQDVFFLRGALQGAMGVSRGDQVKFSVVQGPKGIQAANVQVTSAANGGVCGAGADQVFSGVVKGFDPSKGWGFIACDLAMKAFGKDVFVTKSNLPGGFLSEGMQVQFTVRMEEKGPVAQTVRIAGGKGKGFGGWGMQLPVTAKGPGLGKGSAGYAGVQHWDPRLQQWAAGVLQQWGALGGAAPGGLLALGAGGPGVPGAPLHGMGGREPDESETFFGVMKSMSQEKGWGHVACEALHRLYGKDTFVMKSQLDAAGVKVGQEVQFSVEQGPKGPHATNVRPFVDMGKGITFNGEVKNFNQVKGWGFISCDGSKQVYSADVFLHKKEIGDGAVPEIGDGVQFTVDVSGGRPVAKNVVIARAANR